jgi:hypothetical protein
VTWAIIRHKDELGGSARLGPYEVIALLGEGGMGAV